MRQQASLRRVQQISCRILYTAGRRQNHCLGGSLGAATRMSELNKLGSEVPATLRAALTELCAEGAELRLAHRLHALLLVSLGRSCQEVAGWFGENPRTV